MAMTEEEFGEEIHKRSRARYLKKNAAIRDVLKVLLAHSLTAAEASQVLQETGKAVRDYAKLDGTLITEWEKWDEGNPWERIAAGG